jgi:AcrR family transcriptional regulator
VSPVETRARLVDAAAKVFDAKGYARTTLDEVARAAGFTRGAFHWHFRSKKELLVAVLRARLDEAVRAKDDLAAAAGSPMAFNRAQRRRLSERDLDDMRGRVLLMMEFWLEAARDPELREDARQLKETLREATAAQVESLVAAAGVALPIPSRTVASALMALDDGFALQSFLDPAVRPDELWDVLDFLTGALVSERNEPAPSRVGRR